MGCNCKQKAKPQTVVVNKSDGTIQFQPDEPNYTREELQRVFDFIFSRNQTKEEKSWVINFHNKHFPEQLTPNCAECWVRLKDRMEHLNKKLTHYEQWKETRGETTENIA